MITFNYLMAQALIVLNAKRKKENTAKRIGGLFRDILLYLQNLILGIILKGQKDNETAIKAIVNPAKGDTYKASDTSHYWCYDGSQWNDIGEVISSDVALRGGSEKTVQYIDDEKANKGFSNFENGYVNKTSGEIIPNSVDFKYTIIRGISQIKSITYSLDNWIGGDQVSLIACYNENGGYLGSLLNAAPVKIENSEFLLLEGTETVILTTRDSATMDCSLLPNSLLSSYKSVVGVYDDVNREFLRQFNLTSPAIGVVDYKSLVLLKDTGITHRNFAIIKEPDTASVAFAYHPVPTQAAGVTPSARIAFGNTRVNYFFNFQNNTLNGFVDIFFCTPNDLINIGTMQHTEPFHIGDILRIDRRGLHFKVYVNETLIGSITGTKGVVDPMSGGFGFRDRLTNHFAKNIEIKKNHPKYMHISIDDTSAILRDLTTNAATYTSIFDNSVFAFYKYLHDTYGMVLSLFCFFDYQGFKLSDMTAQYKDEFIANSHWLKLGFHAENKDRNYNNVDESLCVAEYTKVYNHISIFAGYNSIDHMPRFHFFAAKKEALNVLRDTCGLKGCLTADDARVDNSGLTALERTAVNSCDDYFDHENQLYYCRTEYRMDNETAASITPKLEALYRSDANNDIYVMFCHEGKTNNQIGRDMLEACVKWAKEKGIGFDFPQNKVF